MNQGILLLSRNEDLASQLREHVDNGHDVIVCESLDALGKTLQTTAAPTVLVHVCSEAIGDQSPGRFVAKLNDVVENTSFVALVDPECPQRLAMLAEKSADSSLPIPLDYDRLNSLLAQDPDPAAELAGFWLGMPHKELHGHSRSLVTFTPEMFETMDEVKVAAKHDVTVLLIGETGSGKTYLARLIHELSSRREERLCTVGCGTLPPDLIESELFGYVKGAFTGADRDKEGKFAAAGNGSLLLDEIDVLSPDQQAKLLRVMETGEYEPVGSNETCTSKSRLIVASNYNLEDLVHAGTFRTDLYYRLNILKFNLLPLRERPWDVEYLARKFALEHSRTHNIPLREIDSGFLDALRHYHWPGNIREMENVIRRAVLYCQRGVLTLSDLPSQMRQTATGGRWKPQTRETAVIPAGRSQFAGHPAGRRANDFALRSAESHLAGAGNDGSSDITSHHADGSIIASQQITLEARVDMVERRIIEDCLRRNNHRRKETAAELGISRVTLYNKMKKFGLMD